MPSNIAIASLPAAGAVTSGNVLPLVQGGVTVQAQVTALVTGLPEATSFAAGTMPASDKAKMDAATSSSTASTLVQRDASSNFSANVITAARVTGLSAPVNASDAAPKSYVDASAAGLTIKTPVRVATTTNVTLTGGAPNTLDGISLALNDRILVKNQTNQTQNGIYYVDTLGTGSNGTWSRTTDADTGAELPTGSYVFVNSGTVNGSSSWVMTTTGTITIGTSNIVWALYSQLTTIPAASIVGQIVSAQIAESAITTAKFAAGLTPVEIVGTLPSSGNFEGRQAFLTTDNKLYRYTGTAWTASVATVDLTGQIVDTQITDAAITATKIATSAVTTTKIADDAITTPKLVASAITSDKINALAITADKVAVNAITSDKIAANAIIAGKISTNAVTAGTIAANAVTAGTIDANAVTAGTIAAGAVNTDQLAANAVRAGKIYAGAVDTDALAANAVTAGKILAGTITGDKIAANTITSDKITVSDLSAISANIGTITSGSITASGSVSVGTGTKAVSINSTNGLQIAGGRINAAGNGTAPWIRVYGTSTYADHYIEQNGGTGIAPPLMAAGTLSGGSVVSMSTGALSVTNAPIIMSGTAQIKKDIPDNYTPALFDGNNTLEFRWSSVLNTLYLRVGGTTVIAIGPP